VIRAGRGERGATGLDYFAGISARNAGSTQLCLQLVRLAPGARAQAHLHEGHESALYVLSGRVGMWYGERLEEYVETRAGDFVFIPAGVPHLPFNLSAAEPAEAVVARSDPNEQEGVVPLPALDALPHLP
jgi:uncharacterized RmlC-like cupin family protein